MRRTLVVCIVLAATLCSSAAGGAGLLVGVSEDGMKWSPQRGRLTARHMYRLGIGAVRVTFRWSPGQSAPRPPTLVALHRAVQTAGRRRLVLAVNSRAARAPQIARFRRQYCGFVGKLLVRAGRVRDVVIWNEPNSSAFWRPQFGSNGEDAAAGRSSTRSATTRTRTRRQSLPGRSTRAGRSAKATTESSSRC